MSGDIDGIVSAFMLGSVAPEWEIVALLAGSATLYLHPSVASGRPSNLFGVDVFSPAFDNISNHIILYGRRELTIPAVRTAFAQWDASVLSARRTRLFIAPNIWAKIQSSYETKYSSSSCPKYKYPLGSAQILLATLESAGLRPKLYERRYLPWLIANCDGGVNTFYKYSSNAGVWWPAMAGAVGPDSYTEQICQRLHTMRLHDFRDAVTQLDRERQSEPVRQSPWLDDEWKLANTKRETLIRAMSWLRLLTGWRDPVRGGIANIATWEERPIPQAERVLIYESSKGGAAKSGKRSKVPPPTRILAKTDPAAAATAIANAANALNANFYVGGQAGSRFNWVGGASW